MFSECKGIKFKTNNKKKNWETQKYVKIKQKAQATNDSVKKYKGKSESALKWMKRKT